MDRRFLHAGDLTQFVRATCGSSRKLTAVDRLAGGTQKGVYRITLDDGGTAILYVWSDGESYWGPTGANNAPMNPPAYPPPPRRDPFAPAAGVDVFATAQARLAALGVATPEIRAVDTSHRHVAADLALVEDVPGGTLEECIRRSPDRAASILDELGRMLVRMHQHRDPRMGRIALVQAGVAEQVPGPREVVLDRAARQLDAAADRVASLAAVRDRLDAHLRSLAAEVRPRSGYGLIHGELGPDHVLLRDGEQPVLIDIEGLMFFDIEWEHTFLQLRFGDAYEPLRSPDLDPARLRFYEYAQSLSLIEGPLRLADTDFPGRDFMLDIARQHTAKVLRLATQPRWSGVSSPSAGRS